MKASNLPDTEFKTVVIRMLKELSENFKSMKKDIETIKKNQSEMKATLTEMKNNFQLIKRNVYYTENQVSDLEYKETKTIQSE